MNYNDYFNGNNNFMPNNSMQNYQPYVQPNNYGYNNMFQNQQNITNTNKIYVSGVDDVKTKALPPNSDIIFIDNDKDIIYEKIVDATGKHEIKMFKVSEYTAPNDKKDNASIDLSNYVKKDELEQFTSEFKQYSNTVFNVQNEIKKLDTKISNFIENNSKKIKGE